ncbi:MAG: putative ABC exporter domain-containing protein [Acutalibacteraceae bacterium]|jgi:hypothetical protein
MKSLIFMMRKTMKNILRDLVNHPAKLVAYLLLAVIFLFAVFSSAILPDNGAAGPQKFADPRILRAVFLGLMMLFSVTGALGGMNQNNSGNGFFRMADVNLLFGAPISPRRILVFALLRSTASTLLLSIFILCYAPMLRQNFGFSTAHTALLMGGYLVTLLISQLLSLFGYVVTSGNPRRTKIWRGSVIALTTLFAAGILFAAAQMEGGLCVENLLAALCTKAGEWFPFAGWVTGAVFGVLAGNTAVAVLYTVLTVLGFGGIVAGFLLLQPDYYEDVLESAEKNFAIRQAQKSGQLVETGAKTPRISRRSMGIGRGSGASAFFFKQMKETSRRSRIPFVDIFTLVMLTVMVLMPKVMQGGEDGMSAGIAFGSATVACIYLQFFSSSMGAWGRELTKPYLYLVPASPMAKLLWGSALSLLKPAVDAAVIFTVAGLVGNARLPVVVLCALTYISFGAVFTASNILSQRLLGQMTNKGMIILLYMLMLGVILLPGVVVGFVLTVALGLSISWMLVSVIVWNFIVSALIYLLCRATLHSMETA